MCIYYDSIYMYLYISQALYYIALRKISYKVLITTFHCIIYELIHLRTHSSTLPYVCHCFFKQFFFGNIKQFLLCFFLKVILRSWKNRDKNDPSRENGGELIPVLYRVRIRVSNRMWVRSQGKGICEGWRNRIRGDGHEWNEHLLY